MCRLERRSRRRGRRERQDATEDSIQDDTDASDTSENFYDALETLNRKEMCDDSQREDAEFRELKSLLLKFEKNAPNLSSDFDMTSYEELVESSNNNLVAGSDSDEVCEIYS